MDERHGKGAFPFDFSLELIVLLCYVVMKEACYKNMGISNKENRSTMFFN